MSNTFLMFLLVAGSATAADQEPADKNPKKAQTSGKQPGKTHSYSDDDLDRVAGRKPWSEQTEEERKHNVRPEGTVASPVVDPLSASENRRSHSVEAGAETPGSGQDVASRSTSEIAPLQARIERLEANVKSLDTESRQLLDQRLLSTDTNEILRLRAEQGEVQQRLENARQELAQTRKDLDSVQSAARR